jgi:hypothetical protein
MIRYNACTAFTYFELTDVSCTTQSCGVRACLATSKHVAVTLAHMSLALGRGVASVRLLKVALLTTQTRHTHITRT